jgi:phage tail tube protein FII
MKKVFAFKCTFFKQKEEETIAMKIDYIALICCAQGKYHAGKFYFLE